MTLLNSLEPCDCRRMTVLRQEGVPVCNACQQAKREFARTWVGQETPVFKMDELVKSAVQNPTYAVSVSFFEIAEAWQHDQELKRAMETMRYEDWRRQHPHKTKQELTRGLK